MNESPAGQPPRASSPQPEAKDRISLRDRLAFTSGFITASQSVDTFNRMLVPIYQITLGVNPVIIGAIQTLMRLWDAVTDPLVAGWSDNLRSRWGRRRPFIFAGGILIALIFPLLWLPTEKWDASHTAVYLAIAALVFMTAHTIFNIPYEALGVELTEDTNERTRLYAFRSYFGPVLGLGAAWLYAFIQSDFFGGTLNGMRIMGWIFALVFLATALWPAILLRERNPKEIERQGKLPLFRSMGKAFTNRAFLCVGGSLFFGQLAANVFNQFSLYAQIYVLQKGDTRAGAVLAGWVSVVHFVVFMGSIGIGAKLAQIYSKRTVAIIGAVFTFVAGLSKLVLYNPDLPWLVLLAPVISAPAGAIGSFIISAMMADVAFYDQWRTGERREAIYTATASWLYKLALSLSGVLGGALLVWVGFDQSLGGSQSEFTKRWLVLGLVLGGCLPGLIMFAAMIFYPLSPAVMERCRREIDARNEQAG